MSSYISSVRRVKGRIVITKREIIPSVEEKIYLPRVNLADTVSYSTTDLGRSLFDTQSGPSDLGMDMGSGLYLPVHVIHHPTGPWNVFRGFSE